MALISVILRETGRVEERRQQFDLIGFLLVATFLGALEIVLDRGLVDDWFSSTFIVGFAVMAAVAFLLMIPWELSRRDPMIDIGMVATRQFGACFAVMWRPARFLFDDAIPATAGAAVFRLHGDMGGLVLTPGGLVTMIMMVVVGRLSGKVQPRYLIAIGAVICALAMYDLTRLNGDLGFWFFARSRMLLGVGLPLIFIPSLQPLTMGFRPGGRIKLPRSQCSAKHRRLNRGIPGLEHSGTSRAVSSEPARRERDSIERPISETRCANLTQYFVGQGSSLAQAQQQAFAWIGQQVADASGVSCVYGCVLGYA